MNREQWADKRARTLKTLHRARSDPDSGHCLMRQCLFPWLPLERTGRWRRSCSCRRWRSPSALPFWEWRASWGIAEGLPCSPNPCGRYNEVANRPQGHRGASNTHAPGPPPPRRADSGQPRAADHVVVPLLPPATACDRPAAGHVRAPPAAHFQPLPDQDRPCGELGRIPGESLSARLVRGLCLSGRQQPRLGTSVRRPRRPHRLPADGRPPRSRRPPLPARRGAVRTAPSPSSGANLYVPETEDSVAVLARYDGERRWCPG